jgi:hypothetical protein
MPAVATPTLSPATVYRRLMERLPVRTPQRQIVPMRFNAAQEVIWKLAAPALNRHLPLRWIILKARRLGMSTWIENLLTCFCFFQDYVQAMVIAHESKATERIWAVSDRLVRGSALRAQGTIRGHSIQFRHSLLELATAGSPNATRSADLTACHLSEVAFWRDPAAMLAVLQCLPRSEEVFSIAIIESTANGMVDDGALFYNHWQAASAGDNDFTPIFLPWHTFPAYTSRLNTPLDDLDEEEESLVRDLALTWGQLRWRRRVLANECQGDTDKFNQEYPATPEMAFIMSGLPFFRPHELLWLESYIEAGARGKLVVAGQRIVFEPDSKGRLTIFRPPQLGHQYVIGADSSMGLADVGAREHSRSAAEVVDMATLEQVAEYDAAAPPHVFAQDLALLGKVYNMALLAPEIQSSGGGGGRELLVYLQKDWNYYNIHRWTHPDRIKQGQATMYGWETNARTRPRMIARIREVMQERSAVVHSRLLLTQLRNFGESDSDKMEALAGHDDALFAWGIALMSRSENYVARTLGTHTPAALDERIDLSRLGYATQEAWETPHSAWQDALAASGREAPQGDYMAW